MNERLLRLSLFWSFNFILCCYSNCITLPSSVSHIVLDLESHSLKRQYGIDSRTYKTDATDNSGREKRATTNIQYPDKSDCPTTDDYTWTPTLGCAMKVPAEEYTGVQGSIGDYSDVFTPSPSIFNDLPEDFIHSVALYRQILLKEFEDNNASEKRDIPSEDCEGHHKNHKHCKDPEGTNAGNSGHESTKREEAGTAFYIGGQRTIITGSIPVGGCMCFTGGTSVPSAIGELILENPVNYEVCFDRILRIVNFAPSYTAATNIESRHIATCECPCILGPCAEVCEPGLNLCGVAGTVFPGIGLLGVDYLCDHYFTDDGGKRDCITPGESEFCSAIVHMALTDHDIYKYTDLFVDLYDVRITTLDYFTNDIIDVNVFPPQFVNNPTEKQDMILTINGLFDTPTPDMDLTVFDEHLEVHHLCDWNTVDEYNVGSGGWIKRDTTTGFLDTLSSNKNLFSITNIDCKLPELLSTMETNYESHKSDPSECPTLEDTISSYANIIDPTTTPSITPSVDIFQYKTGKANALISLIIERLDLVFYARHITIESFDCEDATVNAQGTPVFARCHINNPSETGLVKMEIAGNDTEHTPIGFHDFLCGIGDRCEEDVAIPAVFGENHFWACAHITGAMPTRNCIEFRVDVEGNVFAVVAGNGAGAAGPGQDVGSTSWWEKVFSVDAFKLVSSGFALVLSSIFFAIVAYFLFAGLYGCFTTGTLTTRGFSSAPRYIRDKYRAREERIDFDPVSQTDGTEMEESRGGRLIQGENSF